MNVRPNGMDGGSILQPLLILAQSAGGDGPSAAHGFYTGILAVIIASIGAIVANWKTIRETLRVEKKEDNDAARQERREIRDAAKQAQDRVITDQKRRIDAMEARLSAVEEERHDCERRFAKLESWQRWAAHFFRSNGIDFPEFDPDQSGSHQPIPDQKGGK